MLAHGRRAGREGTFGGVSVELAAAGHRTLAPDVKRGEGVELPAIGLADNHPVLLLHRRVGRGRVHAAEFERRPFVAVEIGQDRRGRDGFRRESERRAGAHRTPHLGHRSTVLGDEQARDPVIGPRALDIMPNHRDAGRPTSLDRLVQFLDRRLFEAKRLVV